ncbi:MAG: ComEC family competence protein, partial [Sphingomonadales bacterium]|nr:ComEC family competence protein [Sphingomonadales bacterium]
AALLVAALGWQGATRPPVLIAEGGRLVGVIGPAGRVQSKPGQAFVAERWLEADGDDAGIEAAAARAGFEGPRGARAGVFGGQRIVHLSGKDASAAPLIEACRDGALVVLAARAPAGDWGGCDLWDEARLAQTGAVALWPGRRIVSVAAAKGLRPWTAPDRGR